MTPRPSTQHGRQVLPFQTTCDDSALLELWHWDWEVLASTDTTSMHETDITLPGSSDEKIHPPTRLSHLFLRYAASRRINRLSTGPKPVPVCRVATCFFASFPVSGILERARTPNSPSSRRRRVHAADEPFLCLHRTLKISIRCSMRSKLDCDNDDDV
jgi:hypothetical protein